MSKNGSSRTRAIAVAAAQCLMAVLLNGISVATAQQLPIRHYKVSDGLASNSVTSIYQDAKGCLWFGTWGGLSRFDGYRFTNYGPKDGLPHPIVNDVTEDRWGRLWVATNGGGVARLIEASPALRPGKSSAARKKFVGYLIDELPDANKVNKLLIDTDNTLWCLSDAGIYRAVNRTGDLKFAFVLGRKHTEFLLQAAFADRHGRLWFGTGDGLMQINQEHMIRYGRENRVGRHPIVSIVEDRQGKVLVANRRGLFEFLAPTDTKSRGRWEKVPLALKPGQEIRSMIADSTGALWIGTNKGLIKYREGQQTMYTTANGLSSDLIGDLAEDREGNLWMSAAGVCKLSSERIVSFTKAEGLPDQFVYKVIEDQQGRIYASTYFGGVAEIGGGAVPIPGSEAPPFNTIRNRIVQDWQGNWWVGTDEGLFHFPGPRPQFRRGKRLFLADEPAKVYITSIHEDSTGMMWVGTANNHLYRFDPRQTARPRFERVPTQGCSQGGSLIRMQQDRSGALWLGWHQCLARWMNGRLVVFKPTPGLPETRPRAFFQDSRGWLWIGLRYQGVSMTKNPTAARPTFVNYSIEDGLSSNMVWSITEDEFGRIYLGTEKGLNQLDPVTGQIRHFTTGDGLAGDLVRHCLKDHHDRIWIGTSTGLSRYDPRAEPRQGSPPPIFLTRIQVAGEDLPLPERGTSQVPALRLSAGQNNLRIEYLGLSFEGERALRYQYKLEGVDQDWGQPTEERSVHYARLAPGSYRFLVRAINRAGTVSPEPSVLSFHILSPIWQRWWFVALVMATLAGLAYALHRFRLRQVLMMERVRQQIATDLHDDMGSGLSQVAILSEVAKREASPAGTEVLTEVANLARSMRDSMSDIVWAVDPRKDRLVDLVQRMRQVTFNLLETDGCRVQFHAPEEREIERIGLAPDRRRHLLLIFKEAITNIARHAQAEHIHVEIALEANALRLTIQDNGCGFDLRAEYDGHGLRSLKQRAEALKASLEIESAPGCGTTIQATIPLKQG